MLLPQRTMRVRHLINHDADFGNTRRSPDSRAASKSAELMERGQEAGARACRPGSGIFPTLETVLGSAVGLSDRAKAGDGKKGGLPRPVLGRWEAGAGEFAPSERGVREAGSENPGLGVAAGSRRSR